MSSRVVAPKRDRLFQESLRRRPFWMLVACSLVNMTTYEQARPALRSIMSRHTIRSLAAADPASLEDDLRPLGLWRVRARRLPLMASAWLRDRPRRAKDVLSLPGCGRYAHDSWAIFLDGRTDVEPDDGKLNWYMERLDDTPRLHTQ
jgi:endonuclease III